MDGTSNLFSGGEIKALNEQRVGPRRQSSGRRLEDRWQGVCRRVERVSRVRNPTTNVFGIDDAREKRQAQIDKAKLQARIDAIVRKK